LQTDPAGLAEDTHLYAYARNDPLDLKDSGGSEVVMSSGTTSKQRATFAVTLKYLSRSPTFNTMYRSLQQSKNTYVVRVSSSETHGFDEVKNGGGVITFNPSDALRLKNDDVTSPAVGFAHEVSHAERFDRDPAGFAKDKESREVKVQITEEGEIVMSATADQEETRAVGVENEVAAEVGEASVRMGYRDGSLVKVSSPTYSCKIDRKTKECP
jgi:hypothetical protein